MSAEALRKALLYPDTVAIIGASADEARLTSRPQRFMAQHRFAGQLFPVNPRRDSVLGQPAFTGIEAIGERVEHATILLDAEPALDALEACGRAGVPVVSMLADGFAESGTEGVARQARLETIANAYGIMVIGPNSTGVVEASRGFLCTTNAAFVAEALPPGKFCVLSQSGSIIGAMLSRAAAVGLGFHSYLSVGNEAVAGVGEIGELLVDDPQIGGFVLFLETIRRPEALAAFARRAARGGKPVVAYLVGRSFAGQSLAASHTGAMVGGARAIEAFLRAQGIVLLDSFDALAEVANAQSLRSRVARRPRHVTVVTTTGGGGGMVYDKIGLAGVPLSPMPESVRKQLAEEDGVSIKDGPLVDVTLAGTRYETMKSVVSRLIASPDTGLVVAAIGSSAQYNPELAVSPIVDAVREAGPDAAPVLAVPIPDAPQSLHLFNAHGVPACRTAESAAEAAGSLLLGPVMPASEAVAPLAESVHAAFACARGRALNELEAGRLLSMLGVPQPRCAEVPADAVRIEDPGFEGPYVLKVLSSAIVHKSDLGGVVTDLPTIDALTRAIGEMRGSLEGLSPPILVEGFLVQERIAALAEAIIGYTRDPVAGPMISVGVGGVLTEVYDDIALRPAPVSTGQAREMLDEVRGFAVLRGYRGLPAGDLDALAQAVAALSRLAMVDSVSEAEINPLLVRAAGQGVVAADAVVVGA